MKLKKYFYKKVESTNNVAIRLIKRGNQRGIILTDQHIEKELELKDKVMLSKFLEKETKVLI